MQLAPCISGKTQNHRLGSRIPRLRLCPRPQNSQEKNALQLRGSEVAIDVKRREDELKWKLAELESDRRSTLDALNRERESLDKQRESLYKQRESLDLERKEQRESLERERKEHRESLDKQRKEHRESLDKQLEAFGLERKENRDDLRRQRESLDLERQEIQKARTQLQIEKAELYKRQTYEAQWQSLLLQSGDAGTEL